MRPSDSYTWLPRGKGMHVKKAEPEKTCNFSLGGSQRRDEAREDRKSV